MLESFRGFFLLKKHQTLSGKVFKLVGISFSSILLLTGVFFTYTNWSNSTSNAQKYYIEQAQVNATGAKMRTYRAIGTVRTLSIAIDNLIEVR